ncbi:sirohydrochlorin cobaltochelatase [Desulfovibrio legallii]|uniref:Sirohydrochlorin cobaltochelatase n=1 Tax=Desulfovibrio legallii TaxID=571438 RepID=A0A1G7L4C8_9BACT|nr:sirohydrochlorin cobaltochelatase [Desulfovibrio legallii]SDF44402.1 sirohydrochlorin cobaltochelatase [Desulfovibrio legallii]
MSRISPLAGSRLLLLLFLLLTALAAAPAAPRAAEAPKQGILLVAFGTSVPEALPAMEAVDKEFKQAFPGEPVIWAYTSQIIRKKIAAQGRPVGGISDGLAQLAKDGAKVVRVQSLHIMAGEEFSALERAVLIDLQKNPGRFDAVYLGRPMLESAADARALAAAVNAETKTLRGKNAALVLMGHGQEHGRAGLTFEGVRALFHNQDKHVFMATVEGERSFDDLLKELKAAKVKSVVLSPLMLVAGDHARNDLAGDEDDSWASRLKAAGFKVTANLKGLGQVPGARAILVQHAKNATDDLTKEPRKK